jgi:hypothetical protein
VREEKLSFSEVERILTDLAHNNKNEIEKRIGYMESKLKDSV